MIPFIQAEVSKMKRFERTIARVLHINHNRVIFFRNSRSPGHVNREFCLIFNVFFFLYKNIA